MSNNITHVNFDVSCNECKYCYKKEMKCRPESDDCREEYDLEKSDFTTLKKCDFWYPKDGLYFWVSTKTAVPAFTEQIVKAKVTDFIGNYMTEAHYNSKKDCWYDKKGVCLNDNVYEWAIEI